MEHSNRHSGFAVVILVMGAIAVNVFGEWRHTVNGRNRSKWLGKPADSFKPEHFPRGDDVFAFVFSGLRTVSATAKRMGPSSPAEALPMIRTQSPVTGTIAASPRMMISISGESPRFLGKGRLPRAARTQVNVDAQGIGPAPFDRALTNAVAGSARRLRRFAHRAGTEARKRFPRRSSRQRESPNNFVPHCEKKLDRGRQKRRCSVRRSFPWKNQRAAENGRKLRRIADFNGHVHGARSGESDEYGDVGSSMGINVSVNTTRTLPREF